ncbi:MAG: hypothetical protein IJZ32_00655 [Clostridia bacterium]|nr:hypothetical protein [Clostridia bacterium]
MKKPIVLTGKFTENLLRYVLYFLLVAVTPLLAKPTATLFDWVSYGQLRVFFTELFTAIFWLLEFAALILIENAIRKKLSPQTEESTAEEQEEQSPKQKKAKRVKEQVPPLAMWRVGALTAIAAVCILVISAQIRFEVKPFYDIGEKVTGYELLDKIGAIVRNVVKCVWITLLLKAAYAMSEELLPFLKAQDKPWLGWLLAGAMLMLFGVYDVLVWKNPFAVTYLLFYATFTAVYYFAEKRDVKTYLLILFIYIF